MNLARVAWPALALLCVPAACSRKPESSQPAVVVAPGPAAPAQEPEPTDPAANPSTNRIQCGNEVCDATSQMCCGFSGERGCAERVKVGPGTIDPQVVEPLIASCQNNVKSRYSFDSLWLCDDSTDCPDGFVCCSQWLWSGADMLACIPASERGDLVCDYHERCAGETCRTRDTHCVKNECRRKDVRVVCAGKPCDKNAPVCCQRGLESPPTCEPACEATGEEDRAFEFVCSDSSHCPPGATCQAGMFGSYCATQVDTANALVLCASDNDCPKDGCAWMGKQTPPKCVEGPSPGFLACSCE